MPDATGDAWHRWLLPLVLLLGVFGLYASTAEQEAVNTDAYAASVGAWRIATAGTPFLDGLDVQAIDGTHDVSTGGTMNGQWLSESANGHVTAQRMAGPILAGVPFYWLLADGTSEADFSLVPGAMAAASVSALAVLLVFLALRRHAPTTLAVTGALVFALATPTWSVSANGLWTHPVTQLGIAGAGYAATRNRWWLAGVFLGIGMLGRPHVALVAAVLGLGVAWSRRDWRVALGVAVPSVSALGVLAAWNRAVHGEWSIGGAYSGAVQRAAEGVGPEAGFDQLMNYAGFLVSLDRGFLVWSPVVLLLLPAVYRARRALPDWSLWLALGGLLYTFFQMRLNYFAGGTGFHAYRHGLELLTCLTPALVLSAPYLGRIGRLLVPVVVAVQVAAFTIGAVAEGFFVPLDQVWTDNGFWLALRSNPSVVGAWLASCVVVGVLVAVRYVPPPSPAPADALEPATRDDRSSTSHD